MTESGTYRYNFVRFDLNIRLWLLTKSLVFLQTNKVIVVIDF